MIFRVSPREAQTIIDLLSSESGFAFARGKKLESDYLMSIARKVQEGVKHE